MATPTQILPRPGRQFRLRLRRHDCVGVANRGSPRGPPLSRRILEAPCGARRCLPWLWPADPPGVIGLPQPDVCRLSPSPALLRRHARRREPPRCQLGRTLGLIRSLPLLLGSSLGLAALVGAAGVGFGALLEVAPILRLVMLSAGSAYVLWLAWRIASAGRPEFAGPGRHRAAGFLGGGRVAVAEPEGLDDGRGGLGESCRARAAWCRLRACWHWCSACGGGVPPSLVRLRHAARPDAPDRGAVAPPRTSCSGRRSWRRLCRCGPEADGAADGLVGQVADPSRYVNAANRQETRMPTASPPTFPHAALRTPPASTRCSASAWSMRAPSG